MKSFLTPGVLFRGARFPLLRSDRRPRHRRVDRHVRCRSRDGLDRGWCTSSRRRERTFPPANTRRARSGMRCRPVTIRPPVSSSRRPPANLRLHRRCSGRDSRSSPTRIRRSSPSRQRCRVVRALADSRRRIHLASSMSESPRGTPSHLRPGFQRADCGPSSPSIPRSCSAATTTSSTTARFSRCPWCSRWTALASSAKMVRRTRDSMTSRTCWLCRT